MSAPAPQRLAFGPFVLDISEARLTRDGEPLMLPPKAFAVLACLAQRPGHLVSKEDMLDIVWGHRHVSEGVIKTVVSELRAALGDDPRQPRWVETVARRGYRFVGAGAGAGAGTGTGTATTDGDAAPTLFGRDAELAQLQACWCAAQGGQRRLVLVGGEPGSGKSTLLAAFADTVGHARVIWGQCVEAYGSDEPYLPVLEALGQWCAADPALVASVRHCAPTWLVQMPWLVTEADRATLQQEVAGATQDRMLREMGALLDRLAQVRPLLLVLEDLHWSDTATLRLLDALVRRRAPAALMIACSYRPAEVAIGELPFGDLRREWRLHNLYDEVALEGWSAQQLDDLLTRRFGPRPAHPDFVQALYRHTEGLPLFVLGVLDELVEAGVITPAGHGESWCVELPPGASLPVPASVTGVIDKQFMRLPAPVRHLLETAALAAPQFQHLALADALALPGDEVREQLDNLVRRRIWLRETGVQQLPDGRVAMGCAFTHALIRHTLARRVGPALQVERHRALADALERSWGLQRHEIARELIVHAELGQQPLRAALHCAPAARHALQRKAPTEACATAQHGLDLIAGLPVDDARLAVERPLLALRLTATMLTDGLSSAAARPLVEQALYVASALPVSPESAALWHAALLVHVTGRLPGTSELARRYLDGAQAGGDPHCQAAAHNMMGIDLLHHGAIHDAIAHFEQALALEQSAPTVPDGILWRDPRIETLAYLRLSEDIVGRFGRADRYQLALDELLGRGTDLISEGLGRAFQAHGLCYRRDAARLRPIGEHCVALLEARQTAPSLQPHRMTLGWARATLGEVESGVALGRLALERYVAQGSRQGLAIAHAIVGETLLCAGDLAGAQACVDAGMAAHRANADQFGLTELWLLQGEVAAARDPACAQAEQHLRHGIAVSQAQGTLLPQVRIWLPLAQVLHAQGRSDEARAGVQSILARCETGAQVPAIDALQAWLAADGRLGTARQASALTRRSAA